MAWNLLKDLPGSFGQSLAEVITTLKTLWENIKRLNRIFQPTHYTALIPADKTFAQFITDMGTTESTLYINSAVSIPASLEIPTTIKPVVVKGGSFAIANGATLTMPVPEAGEYTIFTFTGTGTVSFSKGRYAIVDWFGADPTGTNSSQTAFDKCKTACDAVVKSFCIPIGTYDVEEVNWRGIQGWKIFGYGQLSVINGAVGGDYVVNLGDPDHDDEAADAANATRDCKFVDFYITATAAYTYGLNSDWCVHSIFDGIHVASDTFKQAGRFDFSWGNKWIGGSYQGENGFEFGDNNCNQNSMYGVRFRCNGTPIDSTFTVDTGTNEIIFPSAHGRVSGYKIQVYGSSYGAVLPGSGNLAAHTVYWMHVTSSTRAKLTRTYADAIAGTNLITIGAAGSGTHKAIGAGFAFVARGQDNTLYDCDGSNGLHGFVMGRTRGFTFDSCYSEPYDNKQGSVFSFGQLQAVSDCVNIRGTYILGGGAYFGISCIGGQGHNALVVQGNYFRNVVYAVGNPANFVNPQFGPNYFEIYQHLTMAAGGHTSPASDIGKAVVSGSDYGGTLVDYYNDETTYPYPVRTWVVLTTTLFPIGASVTIPTGTGAGTISSIIGDKYTRPLAHDHAFQEDTWRQDYNRRRYTVNVGSVSGPADTVITSIYKLTADRPAVVKVRLVGRDSSSANKEIRGTISIDDAGAIESWSAESTTPTGAAAFTGFDVSGGNLRALGLESSNWNAVLDSAIWED